MSKFWLLLGAIFFILGCQTNEPKKSAGETMPTNQKFNAATESTTIAGQPLVDLSRQASGDGYQIVGVKIAPAAGGAPVEISVQKPDGSTFNLLGTSTPKSIEARYQQEVAKKNPYATNEFFKPGVAAPFWPMANRLVGPQIRPGVMQAEVKGQTVTVPVNNGLGPDQRPHHLHGLLFAHAADQSSSSANAEAATFEATFGPAMQGPFWTGQSEVKVTEHLKDKSFEFWIEAKNTGSTPVPVGLGAHPYFMAPSGDASAVRLWIPGSQTVDIDNYANVLPTGHLHTVKKHSEMDFNHEGGVALNGRYLDNLWVDLHPDKDGFAFTEFIDQKAKFRIRLTALTKNIVGIQCYAPKPETNPALGVFAALELVTNFPDPREALWKKTPTGMALLQPGETLKYGYKLEILPLEERAL